MPTLTAIAMIGLVVLIGYSIIMTLKVFFPKTLIRWADYFAIPIKEQELRPLLEGEEKEKSIEVKGMEVEELTELEIVKREAKIVAQWVNNMVKLADECGENRNKFLKEAIEHFCNYSWDEENFENWEVTE